MADNADREKKLAELKRIVAGNAEKRVFNGKDFSGLSVGGLNIENASFVKTSFDNMNIYNSKFKKCEFSKDTFKDTTMFKVDFIECKFNDIDFNSCTMDMVDIGKDCVIANCKFKSNDKATAEDEKDDIICDVTTLDNFNISPAIDAGFKEDPAEDGVKLHSYSLQIGEHVMAALTQTDEEAPDKFDLSIFVGDIAAKKDLRTPITKNLVMNDVMTSELFEKTLLDALRTTKKKLKGNTDFSDVRKYVKELDETIADLSR